MDCDRDNCVFISELEAGIERLTALNREKSVMMETQMKIESGLRNQVSEFKMEIERLMNDGIVANRKLAEHTRKSDRELIMLREIAERAGAWKTNDDYWVYGNDEVIYETENGVEVKNTADKVAFQYRHLYRKNHKIKGEIHTLPKYPGATCPDGYVEED